MKYPLEWWGEGRDARLLAALDVHDGKVYTVKVMKTVGGDRIALAVISIREWNTYRKYHTKSDIEPEWYSTTQHSKPYAEWVATGIRTIR